MINKIKEQPIWYTLMTIAIFAFAVFFLYRCCYHLLQFPGAVNEYREAADVQLTQAFLNGDNPYRLESLEIKRDMPPVLYQYSFLNSAIAAGIALLLGGRVVLAHYMLALLAMCGSAILAYLLIDRNSQQTVLPMLGAVLTLFCHWRFGYISTTPNSLGIFLSLLAVTIATSPKIKRKAAYTAFLCVLLFYTKLYYVTIAGAIFIFCLLYDRREALKFAAMCAAQGALSVLLIQWFWPLYNTYSFYFLNGTLVWTPISRMVAMRIGTFMPAQIGLLPMLVFSKAPISYVFEQFGYLMTVFSLLFLILLCSLIMAMIKKRKIRIAGDDVLFFAVVAMITQGLCLFVVGRADGAYLSYFLQLWMPYVIIAGLICLERYLRPDKTILHLSLLAFVTIISLYFGYRRLPLHMMSEDEIAAWQQAAAYIDQYETGEGTAQTVYYSPVLAYLAMDHGKRAYNNGQTGVINEGSMERFEADLPAHIVFPHAGEIIEKNNDYQEKITEDIRNHAYRLITTDDDGLYVDEALLQESGYQRVETLPLAVGNAEYDVSFWAPME